MTTTYITDSSQSGRVGFASGDTVRVKGRNGLYVVLRVHPETGKADLLRCERNLRPVDFSVPLDQIQLAQDYLPELFQWYMESAPVREADGTDG